MCLTVYALGKVAPRHKPPTSDAWWWRYQLSVLAQEEILRGWRWGDRKDIRLQGRAFLRGCQG